MAARLAAAMENVFETGAQRSEGLTSCSREVAETVGPIRPPVPPAPVSVIPLGVQLDPPDQLVRLPRERGAVDAIKHPVDVRDQLVSISEDLLGFSLGLGHVFA